MTRTARISPAAASPARISLAGISLAGILLARISLARISLHRISPLLFVAGMLVAAAAFSPASAGAQARLDEVDGHANEGRVAEARGTLETWWERDRAGASRAELQRALWLRGILTLDPALAAIDYQRLVTEFPGGPYSDRALLRLAQAAHVGEDIPRATDHYRHLVRDYPGSVHRADAEAWLSRFANGSATAGNAERRPPATTTNERGAPPTPSTSATGSDTGDRAPFAIQLGAFQGEEGARRLIEDTAAAGIEVRLVRTPGSDLVRVRTGRFATREELTPVLERIRGLGFDGFLVADGASERPLEGR